MAPTEDGRRTRRLVCFSFTQNAYIERFNRTYRSEALDAYLFETLGDVRQVTEKWLKTYNEERPHDALGQAPPAGFREQTEKTENAEVSTL